MNVVSVLLINDCAGFHSGSTIVTMNTIAYIHSINKNSTIDKVARGDIVRLKKVKFDRYQVVLYNGEGALHHNAADQLNTLRVLSDNKRSIKRLILYNATIQNFDVKYLKVFDRIYTREIFSHDFLLAHNIDSSLVMDFSLYFFNFNPPITTDELNDKTTLPFKEKIVLTHFNQFKIKRNDVINYLDKCKIGFVDYGNRFRTDDFRRNVICFKQSSLVITDLQHVFLASILAHTRCICFQSNTWKSESIVKTLHSKLPILKSVDELKTILPQVIRGDFDEEFEKLFTNAASRTIPDNMFDIN